MYKHTRSLCCFITQDMYLQTTYTNPLSICLSNPLKMSFSYKSVVIHLQRKSFCISSSFVCDAHLSTCIQEFAKICSCHRCSTSYFFQKQEYSSLPDYKPSLSAERTPASFVSGQKEQLFSVDQIRQGESPWKVHSEALILKQKNKKKNLSLFHALNANRLGDSSFKKRLQERRKVRILYGDLSSKTLDRYLRKTGKNQELIVVLESRLDVVLKRASFFSSIQSARQSILHRQISVNRIKVTSPAYQCKAGDLIQVIQKRRLIRINYFPSYTFSNDLQKIVYRNVKTFFQSCILFSKTNVFASEALSSFKNEVFKRSKMNRVSPNLLRRLFISLRLMQTSYLDFKSAFLCGNNLQSRQLKHVKRSFGRSLAKLEIQVDLDKRSRCIFSFLKKDKEFSSLAGDHLTILRADQDRSQDKNRQIEDSNLYSSCYKRSIKDRNVDFRDMSNENQRSIASTCSQITHLEISHRNLSVIFLYPPQRVCLPVLIDFQAI